MSKLVIHTRSGSTIEAPFEAWVVALINALPDELQQKVFACVAQLEGASLIPDKYLFREDELGRIQIVERPTIDLGRKL